MRLFLADIFPFSLFFILTGVAVPSHAVNK